MLESEKYYKKHFLECEIETIERLIRKVKEDIQSPFTTPKQQKELKKTLEYIENYCNSWKEVVKNIKTDEPYK